MKEGVVQFRARLAGKNSKKKVDTFHLLFLFDLEFPIFFEQKRTRKKLPLLAPRRILCNFY
jgi:hypothetical protein